MSPSDESGAAGQAARELATSRVLPFSRGAIHLAIDARERDRVAPVCVPANEQNLDRLHAEVATHS